MAGVLWRGSVRFGTIAIPVGLVTAQQRRRIQFRTLHAECGQPIRQLAHCPEHGAVEPTELVKGWEFAPGQFVLVDDDELEAVAPRQSRAIEILRFVDGDQVGPLYLDRAYHLAPAEHPVGRRAYALVARALRDTGKLAVARFVCWGNEHVCLLRPVDAALALQTLYRAEDLRPLDLDDVANAEPDADEIRLACELVAKLTGPFEPDTLPNRHQEAVRSLLEAKLAGGEIIPAPLEEPLPPPPADLRAALEASLKAAKRPRARRARKPAGAVH